MRKTGPDKRTVELIHNRSAGICERCGWAEGQQIHHRRARGMGGTRRDSTNAVYSLAHLCHPCHSLVESNRLEALSDGWLVSQHGDPSRVPVLYRGTWRLLDNEGGWMNCESGVSSLSSGDPMTPTN
jgi:hypothetical protein